MENQVNYQLFASAVSFDMLTDTQIADIVRKHFTGVDVKRGKDASSESARNRFEDRAQVGDFFAELGTLAGSLSWGVGMAKSGIVTSALAARVGLVGAGERETAVSAAWREYDEGRESIEALRALGGKSANIASGIEERLRKAVIAAHKDKRSAALATPEQVARLEALQETIRQEVENRANLTRGTRMKPSRTPAGKPTFVPEGQEEPAH